MVGRFSSSGLIHLPTFDLRKPLEQKKLRKLNHKNMNEKTKFEEMFARLPSSIKETDVLRLPTKKVLAALLELLLHSEARDSRVIYCQNNRLRKLSGIGSQELLPSIQQLIDYDLIKRKVGSKDIGKASEYTINFKRLKEPIVERTFEDLFGEFIDEGESLETPINTTITTTIPITTTITTPIPIPNPTSTAIPNTIPTPIPNPIATTTPTTTPIPTSKDENSREKKDSVGDLKGSQLEVKDKNPSNWVDSLFLDPNDYEEDTEFLMDLNKRIVYNRWDNEDKETAVTESHF